MKRFVQWISQIFHKEQQGLSLVSTLWILTILSILATQLLYSIHIEQRTQRNFLDRAKFHYAARAGFEWTLARLRGDQTPFDSLGESWAETIKGRVEDGIQVGNFLYYRVTITDEASKVNVNTADIGLISNLLAQIGASPDDVLTQALASKIVEGQPYRTVRDLARVEGMTSEFLYGVQQTGGFTHTRTIAPNTTTGLSTANFGSSQGNAIDKLPGLVDLATIYSIDANTDPNGQPRVNINIAGTEELTKINGQQNQPVFTQGEAESLIQQRDFEKIAALVDVQAVSDEIFNNIQDRLTTEDSKEEEIDNPQQQNLQQQNENGQVNINTADVETFESLPGIDQGIAERIVNHRDTQGLFPNIDAIKDVKMLTQQEFIGIVDKITLKDGNTRSGLVNINTAPLEILALLPGMDPQKAEAIVVHREAEAPDTSQIQSFTEEEITGNPFTSISQLSELAEIDFATFREVVDWVTHRSHGYRIEANGVDMANRIISTCIGIIDRTGNEIRIQYWRQDS